MLEEERQDGNHETTDLLSHIGDEISMMINTGGNNGAGRKRKRARKPSQEDDGHIVRV